MSRSIKIEDMEDCPECKNKLEYVPGIGSLCMTRDCPVTDDASLWDGDGNREDTNINIKIIDAKDTRITELEQENQRLRDALLEAADDLESADTYGIYTSEPDEYRAIAQNENKG